MNFEEENKLNRRDFFKVGALSTASFFSAFPAHASNGARDSSGGAPASLKPAIEKYVAKNFDYLLGGKLKEISDLQLKAHFGLYEKYVNNINDIESKIRNFNPSSPDMLSYRGLHAEQTFNLNGVVLHELYFGNLSKKSHEPTGLLKKIIERDFGNTINFLAHLKAVGKVMRGWSIAGFNYRSGRLSVYGLDQHNQLVPTLVFPILVLDVYEHAYMIDFGTDRKKYLEAFVENINWKAVNERFQTALSISHGEGVTI